MARANRLWCSLLAGYYEQTLLTARAFGVRVKELTCAARGDDACRFRLRWLQLDGEPGCVTTIGAPR